MAKPPPLPPVTPPPLPPSSSDPLGYRSAAKVAWWKRGLFLVGMPVELRASITVKKPYLTIGLSLFLIICAAMSWMDFDAWGAFIFFPEASGLDYWVGAFGYAFLHADILHLIGNVYFLLIFGNNVECQFGRRRMFGLFMAALVCGAILHGWVSPRPLIGASGGVFGILVFYTLQFPHAWILWLPFGWMVHGLMLILGRSWIPHGISIRTYLIVYLIIPVILLHEQVFANGNVSALAHLGGGLAGAVIWIAWRQKWLP